MVESKFKGKLLVAKPHAMRDPYFQKSVVYVYEQQQEVVIGLILNKASGMSLTDVHKLRGAGANSGVNAPLYRGGPVSEQSLLLLHTAAAVVCVYLSFFFFSPRFPAQLTKVPHSANTFRSVLEPLCFITRQQEGQ